MAVVAELFAKLGLTADKGSFEKGHEMIKTLHHAMEAFIGVEGLKKVKEMVDSTVEAAVSAKHLGEQLGISTDAVQELGYAANVTGASSEGMRMALQRLALGMEHARKSGSGPLVDALYQLHVPFAKLKGENLEQNLDVLADAFQKAGPHVNKTALAMEIFGRQGAQLLPLLNRGSSGVKALRDEAEKLGVVMDKEAIEKSEEFEIAQKRLGATLTGLRNTAVQALLPTLQEMVEGLMEWVKENRQAIASTLEAVMRAIATAFRLVGKAIKFATDLYSEHKDIAIAALVGIGAALALFAVKAALAWLTAFAPLVAGIAVIAGVVLAIKKLTEWVTGQSYTWGEMWNAAVKGGEAAVDWIEDLPSRVLHFFEEVGAAIRHAFQDAWDFAVKSAEQAWQKIKDTPIIGHVIRGAQAAGGLAGDVLGGTGVPLYDPSKLQAGPFASPGTNAAAMVTSIQQGDVHLAITANGMDADEVRNLANRAAAEQLQDQIRHAYNAAGGTPQAMR